MAQAPRQHGGDGGADFIRNIVSDPKNVPDVMLLTGYLGASSEEGHERLYLSPDLSNFVEIPKTAILHQAPLPKEQDAHGGVTVWVKKDAALQYKMAPAAQALANYFAGAIQAGAQGMAPAVHGGRHLPGGPHTLVNCNLQTEADICRLRPTVICTRFCLTALDCVPHNTVDCTIAGQGCHTGAFNCAFQPQFAANAAAQGGVARTHATCFAACATHVGACATHLVACATHVATCAAATCRVTCAPCHTGVAVTCQAACTHLCTRVGPGCTIGCGVTNPVDCNITEVTCAVGLCGG
jgi:hypothetical protein